ncbi:zinc finger, GRF-type containing protein [Tanacetum coccineum]
MALCFSGLPAVTRTSWTDANPGRRFLGCPLIEGQRCIYFGWLDPPICQRAMLIIPGLLRARNRMEADMMVLV